MFLRFINGRVDGRHGLPTLGIERQEEVGGESDQLVLVYPLYLQSELLTPGKRSVRERIIKKTVEITIVTRSIYRVSSKKGG